MNLVDAPALLVFLQREAGADVVERELGAGSGCSAANWSRTARKVLSRGGKDWSLARGLLLSYEIQIEPVGAADAQLAARLWRAGSGLSPRPTLLDDRRASTPRCGLPIPRVARPGASDRFIRRGLGPGRGSERAGCA